MPFYQIINCRLTNQTNQEPIKYEGSNLFVGRDRRRDALRTARKFVEERKELGILVDEVNLIIVSKKEIAQSTALPEGIYIF